MRRLGRLAALSALLILMGHSCIVPAAAQPGPVMGHGQFRAYWVDSFNPGLYSEAEIDRLVADARAANMNAIVAQVTRRADCFCNRSNMPRTEAEVDPSPFDPLQTLIEKAHAAGLEVHAWLNTTIMWASDVPPRGPGHVFHAHGPSAAGRDNWVMLRHDGANRGANLYFFDLGHPDAADYVVDMFLSIVRNYDVDGINFDYVRYPDYNPALNVPAWGYNLVAVARFQALTGRSDVPEPTDPQWMDWRREQVTNIVRRVYLESARIRPWIRVSADTITYGSPPGSEAAWSETRPYREVLQDWRGWMQEGILDLNIPMNYRREQAATEPNNFRRMYEEWSDFAKDHQYNRQAAVGTALYLNPIEDSVIQIRKALAPSPAGNLAIGWVGFSYHTPDAPVDDRRRPSEEARLELSRVLTQVADHYPPGAGATPEPVFAAAVSPPTMPWKSAPVTGHLRGTVTTSKGSAADQYSVILYNAASNALVASRRTDGSGWFGFVDLSPGQYRVRVEASVDSGTASALIAVIAGRVTPVTLALPILAPGQRDKNDPR
jgi:uncharacterized lipoprotein YddW (UPF0748 family)